jgi:hypothetical protein
MSDSTVLGNSDHGYQFSLSYVLVVRYVCHSVCSVARTESDFRGHRAGNRAVMVNCSREVMACDRLNYGKVLCSLVPDDSNASIVCSSHFF